MSISPKREEERRKLASAIREAALAAVDPAEAVRRNVRREGDVLYIGRRTYALDDYERIFVVGGGKAGFPMAEAIEEILEGRITAGLVNVKHGHIKEGRGKIEIIEAGHPVPDESGRRGAERIVGMLGGLSERDLVIVLISGGGSALLTLPASGIALEDVQRLTEELLACGATINEINSVRKHISRIKGGNLARRAYPADVVALILSDVVGNPLDVIASGPTVPDSTSFEEAYHVLIKYNILSRVPPAILRHLESGLAGEIEETPKEGDEVFSKVYNLIVGSNEIAALAAVAKARELGFNSMLLSTYVEGEAREVAKVFAGIAKEISEKGRPLSPPACLVAGGETTVTIRGEGKGGRNQELALSAAISIEGWDDVMIVSLATDGTDGPTDAAGAIATGSTVARAREVGLSPEDYLAENDSYHFFQALGDLLITGPTNTNVNDLIFVFVF
jgi:hydroxypyruvate reductase